MYQNVFLRKQVFGLFAQSKGPRTHRSHTRYHSAQIRAAPGGNGLWKDRQTQAELAHSPGWANAGHALASWEL